MHISIFDVDGVLLDSSARYRTRHNPKMVKKIDLPHWRANEYLAVTDKPLPLLGLYKKLLADPVQFVIIATARAMHDGDRFKLAHQLGGWPNVLIHRQKQADNRKGAVLKIEGIQQVLAGMHKPESMTAYEDNPGYLDAITNAFPDCRGIFVPSQQGH